jgi:hypothetical protein
MRDPGIFSPSARTILMLLLTLDLERRRVAPHRGRFTALTGDGAVRSTIQRRAFWRNEPKQDRRARIIGVSI